MMTNYTNEEVHDAIDCMFKPLKDKIQGVNNSISETIIILEKLQIKLARGKQ